MSDFDESAALDADAGPGATAILSGMLHTLSEVLERLDERLGRLEARVAAPPAEVDVEGIAESVLDRLRRDDTLARTVGGAVAPLGHAVDHLRSEVASLRDAEPTERLGRVVDGLRADIGRLGDAEPVGPAVERAVAAATEGLRQAVDDLHARVAERTTDEEMSSLRRALDEALMALGDRNEAHALGVREMVTQLSSELRRLAEADDDEATGPDIAALVAEAGQGTERSLARLHADVRGAVEELALAMAERHDGQAAAIARLEAELRTAIGAQASAAHDIQSALGDRLEAELRSQVAPLHELQSAAAERTAAELRAQVAALQEAHAGGAERLADELRSVVAAQAGALHEIQAVVVERLEGQGALLDRLRAEMSAQAFALEQLRSDAGDRPPAAVEGIDRLEASLQRLHAELDERSAGQVALVDRLVAEQAVALARLEADMQGALASVRAELADRPDAAALAAEHADALRRALEEAVSTLAERQAATNASLHQAVDRLRAELVALAEPIGDDAADAESGAEAVAELLARQAAAARDDLARIETVLRGQVAEVSGRANSITDVIGRLDGRLHEVVDGVRALSRHLEATASLVPAVEALRGEVDELRRLSEQPRLRAVNGGSGD